MERICRQRTGLFPSPEEITLSCSCPDWASMCKHVAAALYGIGARLDAQPELLFTLRNVDEKELIAKAGQGLPLAKKGPAAEKILGGGDLSELFGLEMAQGTEPGTRHEKAQPGRAKTPAGKSDTAARTTGASALRGAHGTKGRANAPGMKRGAAKKR